MNLSPPTAKSEDVVESLLELAANNDLESFKKFVDHDPSIGDGVGLWYGRKKGSNQMVQLQRTPLMVAATYGSMDVLRHIISLPSVSVNRSCGDDKSTALHCAASGGSVDAVDAVKLLLAAGADLDLVDANGCRPLDVVNVSPNFQEMKYSLQMMLGGAVPAQGEPGSCVSTGTSKMNSPPISPSPSGTQSNDVPVSSAAPMKKEYPVDPYFPDIKNSIYSTDDFRMFCFKIVLCSRACSHDWTECPFAHPGENARRRDPRKYHYCCVPCPDFRKGACQRGDMCEFAHGVFESWLHPAQYRTQLCKDGTSCNRKVCFFAHTAEELRPLHISTGPATPSPRSYAGGNTMDFAAPMITVPPSTSVIPMMPPSLYAPPISPSDNAISNVGWQLERNVPNLNAPGSSSHFGGLRSYVGARDIPTDGLSLFANTDGQQQQQQQQQSRIRTNIVNHSALLERSFSAEGSVPGYSDQASSSTVFSSRHNNFQQQPQSFLSPIKTIFSPRNIDPSLLQDLGLPSPQRGRQLWSRSSHDLGANAAAVEEDLNDEYDELGICGASWWHRA